MRVRDTISKPTRILMILTLAWLCMGAACLSEINDWLDQHPLPRPTPRPTAGPTASPSASPMTPTPIPATPSGSPTVSPTQSPSPSHSPTPSPAPTATPQPTVPPEVESPILVMFKVQGFNPNRPYNCHNPQDGPKFQNQHICVKDSTEIFCNKDGSKCGPCDTDHMDNYTTFCNNQDWDIVGGPHIHSISGATAEKDGDNPFYTNVTFTPGVAFTLCIRAPQNPKTASGQPVAVQGTAQTCVTETY